MAERITILSHNSVVETGDTARTLSEATHLYTRQLAFASTQETLLDISNITHDYTDRCKSFFSRPESASAIDNVSLQMNWAHQWHLLGALAAKNLPSPSMILKLDTSTGETTRFRGMDITHADETATRRARRNMQVVFQKLYGSFNPRHTVERLVEEPLYLPDRKIDRQERSDMVGRALYEVGLSRSDIETYP